MTADEWNARYPVGTIVAWLRDNGEVLCAKTLSKADHILGGFATLQIDLAQHPVVLDRLRPIRVPSET